MSKNLFGRLLDLLGDTPSDGDGEAQQQREALIDLLVWTMFADRHVASAERSYIIERGQDLPWEGVYRLEVYMDAAVRRIRDSLGSETSEQAYLDDIRERLGTTQARRRAYRACEALASADGDLASAEQTHLERLRLALL